MNARSNTKARTHRFARTLAALSGAALASAAAASDTWVINMTVDNQFDAYVGTASATVGSAVGSGSNWAVAYNFSVSGMTASDYFYVATASDFGGAQGFLGDFTNVTQSLSFDTGTSAWEVLPVGRTCSRSTRAGRARGPGCRCRRRARWIRRSRGRRATPGRG